MRFKWGNLIQCEPSRFLEELDPKFLNETKIKQKSSFINSNSGTPLKNKFFQKSPKNFKKISKSHFEKENFPASENLNLKKNLK